VISTLAPTLIRQASMEPRQGGQDTEWRQLHASIGRGVEACQARQRELASGRDLQQSRTERLFYDFRQIATTSDGDEAVQELSRSYCQLRVAQEEHVLIHQQELCQAYGLELGELEGEVHERQRALLSHSQDGQDLDKLRELAELEKRRREFLERQVVEQSRVWPWLVEQQAQLEEYQHLSSIYSEELAAASETVDALKAESEVWRQRVFEESSAAASAAGRRPDASEVVQAPSDRVSEVGRLYAVALGETLARAPAPAMVLRWDEPPA